MSSTPGFFKGCRAFMAAAKASTAKTSVGKTTAKPKARLVSSNPRSSTSEPRKPSGTTGILKVIPVSPALYQFLGVRETSRTDAVKKIWEYIKIRKLQNPTDKRIIHCDEKLKTIFEGKDKVGFLEIGKLLSRHFVKTN